MKKQITRFSPLQTAKVLALLYFIFSLAFSPFILVPLSLGPTPVPEFPIWLFIFMPLMYLVFGFILTLLAAWIYNLVARWTGGIEFTVIEKP